jgi:hypothetical protein
MFSQVKRRITRIQVSAAPQFVFIHMFGTSTMRYEIRIDEAYLAEGLRRRRKVGPSKYGRRLLKTVATVGLMGLGFAGIIVHAWPVTLFAAILAGVMLLSPRMDLWFYARKLKKTPYYGSVATIDVDDDGYSYRTDTMSAQVSWRLMTAAHRMQDGFILFDTAGSCIWLPNSGLVEGTPEQVRRVLQAHVSRYSAA